MVKQFPWFELQLSGHGRAGTTGVGLRDHVRRLTYDVNISSRDELIVALSSSSRDSNAFS